LFVTFLCYLMSGIVTTFNKIQLFNCSRTNSDSTIKLSIQNWYSKLIEVIVIFFSSNNVISLVDIQSTSKLRGNSICHSHLAINTVIGIIQLLNILLCTNSWYMDLCFFSFHYMSILYLKFWLIAQSIIHLNRYQMYYIKYYHIIIMLNYVIIFYLYME